MKLRGLVAGVRDGSFTAKSGKRYEQWNLDVYDETAGLVPCYLGKDGMLPTAGQKIVADVTAVRLMKFGVGYQFALANAQEIADMPVPPLSAVPVGRK